MTMEKYTRCSHCCGQYLRLVSGRDGYNTNHTDDRFCPRCLDVVSKALASVPVKKSVRLKVLFPTVPMLVAEHQKRDQKLAPCFRVFSNEIDMTDPSNKNIVQEVQYETCKFRYSYWTKTGMENGTVHFEAEISDDGSIEPWSFHQRLFEGMQFVAPDGSVRTV